MQEKCKIAYTCTQLTHTHTRAHQCVGAKRPFHPPLQGSTRSVGQLGGGYRGMGQNRKCEGFAEKDLCGHSGPGRRGAVIPVAENQGVGLRDGDLK